MLLLEAGCLGSFVSLDLIMFFLFFELTLVPVYFVITGWGFSRRAYAATKFFVYTFLGSAFLLVGIVAVAFIHQRQTGHLTFDLVALTSTHLGLASQVLLFLAFTAAFAVKAPIFPFHTWSPDAYAESPTGGAVILAAVMAKMGTYGIIRFDLNLFPRAVVDLAPLLLTLGVIGILYGAIVACVTRDMKRLVAYSSLSHHRVHRARDLRAHHAGGRRGRAADGEPRPHHRRALHRHRVDLRAAPDLAGQRAARACSGWRR